MLFDDKERNCIKYYYFLLESTMDRIKELEENGKNSNALDDLYSNMYMWSESLTNKVEELWNLEV